MNTNTNTSKKDLLAAFRARQALYRGKSVKETGPIRVCSSADTIAKPKAQPKIAIPKKPTAAKAKEQSKTEATVISITSASPMQVMDITCGRCKWFSRKHPKKKAVCCSKRISDDNICSLYEASPDGLRPIGAYTLEKIGDLVSDIPKEQLVILSEYLINAAKIAYTTEGEFKFGQTVWINTSAPRVEAIEVYKQASVLDAYTDKEGDKCLVVLSEKIIYTLYQRDVLKTVDYEKKAQGMAQTLPENKKACMLGGTPRHIEPRKIYDPACPKSKPTAKPPEPMLESAQKPEVRKPKKALAAPPEPVTSAKPAQKFKVRKPKVPAAPKKFNADQVYDPLEMLDDILENGVNVENTGEDEDGLFPQQKHGGVIFALEADDVFRHLHPEHAADDLDDIKDW